MQLSKKAPAKQRPVHLSSLAAQLLGYSRGPGGAVLTTQQITLAFPAFGVEDLANALGELVDKRLVSLDGRGARAGYRLTEHGSTGPVSVA